MFFLALVFVGIELSWEESFLICLFFTSVHLLSLSLRPVTPSPTDRGFRGTLYVVTVGSRGSDKFVVTFCVLRAEV